MDAARLLLQCLSADLQAALLDGVLHSADHLIHVIRCRQQQELLSHAWESELDRLHKT